MSITDQAAASFFGGLRDWHDANVARANAQLAAAGRCIWHNEDVRIPALYLLRYPCGNEVPLCVECCAFARQEAADRPHDESSQPEWIREIEGSG